MQNMQNKQMKNDQQKKGGASAPPHFSPRGIALFATLLLFGGILTGMGSKPPQIGGPASDFQAITTEGQSVRLSDYRGKVLLLTFWATWCEPCKKELPEIEAAYEKHKREGLAVLAVNFGEKREEAETFAKKMGFPFPTLVDRKVAIAERYGVISLPVSFFIDADGIIRERVIGGLMTEAGIGKSFEQIRKP
ncbi:MAG: TlpA family protein disulfide reductase [Nitrospirae bacterium]|nr:TlpA family protein disulfide reductase [Candidatus Manganitrophaceae bacterium]